MPAEIKELLDSIRGASMRSPDDHDEFGALVGTPSTVRCHVGADGASAMQKRPGAVLVLALVSQTNMGVPAPLLGLPATGNKL